MMKEIGSDFEFNFSLFEGNKKYNIKKYIGYHKNNFKYFTTGRSALKYLLRYLIEDDSRFLLPSYLCESILSPLKELDIDYKFYKINKNLQINIEDLKSKIKKDDIIIVLHYFGFTQPDNILRKLNKTKEEYNSIIIEDTTHSVFTNNEFNGIIGDYIITSLRKWLPIPDGAFLASNFSLGDYEIDKGYNYFSFNNLLGQFLKYYYLNKKNIKKDIFLNIFEKAESYIDKNKNNITEITDFSYNILKKINYKEIKLKRQNNYRELLSNLINLKDIKILYNNINENIVPLGFPIIVNDRENLKKFLIKEEIYPPVHWKLPKEISSQKFNKSIEVSKSILTIPCDQRYNIEDMKHISEKILDYYS